MEIVVTLYPLQPSFERNYTTEFAPEWVVIGGLQFQPLSIPLLHACFANPKLPLTNAFASRAEEVGCKFRKELEKEHIFLFDILALDLNYGYKHTYKELKSMNGTDVVNINHLYELWRDAVAKKEEFLTFKFIDDGRIVLETQMVEDEKEQLMEDHRLPDVVSQGILNV